MKTRLQFRSDAFGDTHQERVTGLRDFLQLGLPVENVALGSTQSQGNGYVIHIKGTCPVDLSLWCGLAGAQPSPQIAVFEIEARPSKPKIWVWRKLRFEDIEQDLSALLASVEDLLKYSPDIYDLSRCETA